MLIATPGCSKNEVIVSDDPKHSHVAILSGELAKFQYYKRGAAPKNDAEILAFIGESAQTTLATYGLSEASELLTSKRDGEPIVIIFGKPGRTPEGDDVLAYEKTGVNGKRIVALNGGGFEEMDEARFKKVRLPK